MVDYPPVIVLIITYRRLPLALETIKSVKEKVVYPNIGFHIADDGSGREYVQALLDEIGGDYSVTTSDAKRSGVGYSMNLGVKACLDRADYWLHLEDDWVLPGPLDLDPCVRLLSEEGAIGMVRLGRLQAGLRGATFSAAGKIWWMLEKGSEPYVFTGNPSLRHRRFYEAYGNYAEGLPPGSTEVSYCSRFNGGSGPGVVWPVWLSDRDVFQHIGDSQSFKWWIESGGKTAEEAADIFATMT